MDNTPDTNMNCIEVCPAVVYQDVDVCLPISIKAFGESGNVETECIGKPVVKECCEVCPGKPNNICRFTVSQKLKVKIPVIFGAKAEVGDASVDCGCTKENAEYSDIEEIND